MNENASYQVISIENELPTEEGKYIVKTQTNMGNHNTLEISLHYDKKGKASWSCNNQIVTHWLKEI